MSPWNANHYLRFGSERTRPAHDLVSRIELENPARVVDLGCGPGNSTQVLWERWPESHVVGIDSSQQMIQAASKSHPSREWYLGRAETWKSEKPFDVVFSNAAFQWLADHEQLMQHCASLSAPGGAIAFQIPCDRYSPIRRDIDDIASDPRWISRMREPMNALTMHPAGFYYNVLSPLVERLDIWETEYFHVMENTDSIIDWISSTGLRPYLEALEKEADREEFVDRLRAKVADSYPLSENGSVLYPFRRLFVIGYR